MQVVEVDVVELWEAVMRAWGRAVVVSCATATVLMAVDGCARAEPAVATEAAVQAAIEDVQVLDPNGYVPKDLNGYAGNGPYWPGQPWGWYGPPWTGPLRSETAGRG